MTRPRGCTVSVRSQRTINHCISRAEREDHPFGDQREDFMSEPNYYAAPVSSDRPKTLEARFAYRLLEMREKGCSIGRLYEWMLKGYIFLAVVFAIGISWFAWWRIYAGAYLMLGALFGVLLRDFGILRRQVRLWPVNAALLDWPKVERFASGNVVEPNS
jgi:hypothetical protein